MGRPQSLLQLALRLAARKHLIPSGAAGLIFAMGGGAVAYYRLYFMVETSGQIDRFHEFDAVDDDAAIAYAENLRGPRAMELWSGSRKVKRWPMNFGS